MAGCGADITGIRGSRNVGGMLCAQRIGLHGSGKHGGLSEGSCSFSER